MSDPAVRLDSRQRVWIDCSLTVNGRFHTGVQRVVRLLCRESLYGKHCDQFDFQPVIATGNEFWIATMQRDNPSTLRLSNRPVRWFDDVSSHLPKVYRKAASNLCDLFRFPTLRRWLLPMPGHLGMFRLPAKIAIKWIKDPAPTKAEIAPGDFLILPDSYWSRYANWDAIYAAKRKGARLVFVLYDLIPYIHAELYDHSEVKAFRSYLEQLVELADAVVAISQTVANEFKEYLQNHHSKRASQLPVEYFALGAEFRSSDGFVRGGIRKLLGTQKFARLT